MSVKRKNIEYFQYLYIVQLSEDYFTSIKNKIPFKNFKRLKTIVNRQLEILKICNLITL